MEGDLEPASNRTVTLKLAGLAGVAASLIVVVVVVFLKEPPPDANGTAPDTNATSQSGRVAGALPVQILKAQRRDIAHTLTLPANISPWYQATLYAKVPGYLSRMVVDKGDAVKKGDLLAVIDAPEVDQQFQQAEADYRIKQITFDRLLSVWKENPDVIAKQDVDVAEAAAKGAKHLMENRRTMLAYTKVYAPFSGVITARFADPGAFIQAATGSSTQAAPLYTIMDLSKVRIYASVPQEAALLAKPGVPTVITVRELPGEGLRASITRTTQALDSATRTLLVEIDIPNQNVQLQPGMYVMATLLLKEHPQVLAIPPAALVTGADGKSVFVVEGGRAKLVPVKTGLDDGVWIEITDGLQEGMDVVVVGKSGLTDGQAVQPSSATLPSGKPSSQKY
jgi:RND family efflux transporter MFP subunit